MPSLHSPPKEKIEARNQLENFCYQVKNMAGEQLGDKMSAEDKAAIEKASKDGLEWLDSHQDASKSEIEAKMKEVEAVIQPIVAKAYQQAGAAGGMPGWMPGCFPGGASGTSEEKGPSIEVVEMFYALFPTWFSLFSFHSLFIASSLLFERVGVLSTSFVVVSLHRHQYLV